MAVHTGKAEVLVAFVSPANSARPLYLVTGLKEERGYQLGMRVESGTACKTSTHTSPWDPTDPRVLREMSKFLERLLSFMFERSQRLGKGSNK